MRLWGAVHLGPDVDPGSPLFRKEAYQSRLSSLRIEDGVLVVEENLVGHFDTKLT